MAPLTLTPGEILDLTGRSQTEAQKAALRSMGVDYYVRPDGTLAVLRSVVEKREDSKPEPKLNLSAA